MTKRSLPVATLLVALLTNAIGQQPQSTPTPPPQTPAAAPAPGSRPQEEDEVVRITANLVQMDAVVTDRDGKQVTDLSADDFEILENGRPQPITNFSYIRAASPTSPATAAPARAKASRERSEPPVPPALLRPTEVRRTIALVVDDLMMSAESIYYARRALKKYVDEQVQPGDLVTIVRTGSGIGALQQFTNDRQRLYAAIERVRWSPRFGGGQSALAPINPLGQLAGSTAARTPLPQNADDQRVGLDELNELRQELFTVGTLGALNFVVDGLRELPGRKAVILFSDGLSLQDSRGQSTRYLTKLQRIIDHANRASVVFYTIDARGLQPAGLTAADPYIRPNQIGQVLSQRTRVVFEGQGGLSFLAKETGGLALINNNNINGGIRRALDDMSGYYLIGYRPEKETFDPATGRVRFNRLTIRLKNPHGLRVRTRTGFIGVAEAERPQPRTRAEQLMAALVSPFGAGGVSLRLTSLFINAASVGSVMRSMLLIDPRTLTFTQQADGQYQTVMDVLAVTFGEDGRVIDQLNRVETIHVRPEAFQKFLSEGMVYDLNVPVSQPGAYQLRIAVRDAATERVGSANQYVEVPNLSRKHLTLSGLVIAAGTSSAGTPNAAAGESAAVASEDQQAGPAARRFRRGMLLDYGFFIYNARLDSATQRPRLTIQARLFREGQQVFAGQAQPLDTGQQTDPARIEAAGRLQLGTALTPGEYVLQIVVTDALASEGQRTTTQWMDFELVS